MDIVIKRVNEVDETIGNFINSEFARYSERNGQILNYKDFCFIAEDCDGTMIGIVTGHAYYNEVHIGELVVDENHRKTGLGSRLVSAVEEAFTDKGYEVITLSTYEFQAPKFYQKLGYKIEFIRKSKIPELNKYYLSKVL